MAMVRGMVRVKVSRRRGRRDIILTHHLIVKVVQIGILVVVTGLEEMVAHTRMMEQ